MMPAYPACHERNDGLSAMAVVAVEPILDTVAQVQNSEYSQSLGEAILRGTAYFIHLRAD